MVAPATQYEWEALGEAEASFAPEGEWENEWENEWEGEQGETGEQFLGDAVRWARGRWNAAPEWQRKAALTAARSAMPGAGKWLGERVGGWIGPNAAQLGGVLGQALGDAGVSLLPDREWEAQFEAELAGEGEWEGESGEAELNPVRKVYLDAMLEHMAHEAEHAESEQEAAEGFLPLIPLLAGKLLPLAAKALPKVAMKVFPKIAKAVTRTTPQLSRGISNITRTLYRNPRTRKLVRAVPRIAQNTVVNIARQAARGRTVTPQAAQRVLANQTYRVLSQPQATAFALRRNAAQDRRYHGLTGIPASAPPAGVAGVAQCPTCGGFVSAPQVVAAAMPPMTAMPTMAAPAARPRPTGGGPRYRCQCCNCGCRG